LSLRITLFEDRNYNRNEILEELKAQNIEQDIIDDVCEDIYSFFHDLQMFIGALNKYVYRDLDIESPVPFVNRIEEKINTGEWIGVYRHYSKSLGEPIEILIKPKIGYNHFCSMLNETFRLRQMIGYHAINVLSYNIYGHSNFKDSISYSTLLQQFTELMLSEGIPPLTYRKDTILNDFCGPIKLARTQRLWEMGVPLVVARKMEVGAPRLPLMITVKFHLILQSLLINELNKIQRLHNDAFEPIQEMLKDRISYHSYVLLNDVLRGFVSTASTSNLEDINILEEARKQAGKAKWMKDIIDLYESFMYRKPPIFDFINKWRQNIPIQPIPSSKVYELWILTLFMEIFREKTGKMPKIEFRGGGAEFDFRDAKIEFNVSRPEWSKIFYGLIGVPRPDYMLVNGGRKVVADAKYREFRKLSIEDFERMIAYIIDYSEPQDHEEVKGFFITLGTNNSLRLKAERSDTTPNIRIYQVNADPRYGSRAREGLMQIYQKFLHA